MSTYVCVLEWPSSQVGDESILDKYADPRLSEIYIWISTGPNIYVASSTCGLHVIYTLSNLM